MLKVVLVEVLEDMEIVTLDRVEQVDIAVEVVEATMEILLAEEVDRLLAHLLVPLIE
jgi:hypothetical protein